MEWHSSALFELLKKKHGDKPSLFTEPMPMPEQQEKPHGST
jgi:hypothetical protein